ncbi:hypothetical protein LXL04_037989 [Taraxacum kok-saghyz]
MPLLPTASQIDENHLSGLDWTTEVCPSSIKFTSFLLSRHKSMGSPTVKDNRFFPPTYFIRFPSEHNFVVQVTKVLSPQFHSFCDLCTTLPLRLLDQLGEASP